MYYWVAMGLRTIAVLSLLVAINPRLIGWMIQRCRRSEENG